LTVPLVKPRNVLRPYIPSVSRYSSTTWSAAAARSQGHGLIGSRIDLEPRGHFAVDDWLEIHSRRAFGPQFHRDGGSVHRGHQSGALPGKANRVGVSGVNAAYPARPPVLSTVVPPLPAPPPPLLPPVASVPATELLPPTVLGALVPLLPAPPRPCCRPQRACQRRSWCHPLCCCHQSGVPPVTLEEPPLVALPPVAWLPARAHPPTELVPAWTIRSPIWVEPPIRSFR